MGNKMNTPHKEPPKSKIRNTILALLAIFLFASIISATIISLSHKKQTNNAAQRVIKSTCASTLYPDLCISSLQAAALSSTIVTPIHVINAAIDATISNVKKNKFIMEKIATRKSLNNREKVALKDCLETTDNTLDELQKVILDLTKYPSDYVSTDDLMIWLSAARTNQRTCIDGFSHHECDKEIRSEFFYGQIHVSQMCSIALAMIKNISGSSNGENSEHLEQKMKLEDDDGNENSCKKWPKWLSAGDKKQLQTRVMPNVTVAADGSGEYSTVSEAVAAAPCGSTRRYVIKIKAGVYRENVVVPKNKTNLTFVGDGQTNTIITASKNTVDGSTTFDSATFAVNGHGVLARDITFQNAAGPAKYQAVALRVSADKTAFYRCGMIGYQDTLFVHSFRQFYVKCYIAGTIDYIFGNAAVVLQDCDIHSRLNILRQKNVITAQGRDDPNENTGIVIQKCRIGATSDLQGLQSIIPTYLGRPWKRYSRTIIMQSVIGDVINPAGWLEWNGTFALDTLFYGEYANTGPGSNTSNRVTWKGSKVITNADKITNFTAENFISGENWLQDTAFPFSLGL